MTFYLTYAEPPSGVYSSQVSDVIRFVNRELNTHIKLVAFISLHEYKNKKAHILKEVPDALVLPMLPKATFWKLNVIVLWTLCLIYRPTTIIARNVIAANMALRVRNISPVQRVCFDGRGAIAAEWNEYDVTVVDSWKKAIDDLEGRAVNETDFRIAVTEKLVDYWHEKYGYTEGKHVVIPCTLNSDFAPRVIEEEEKNNARKTLGADNDDVILVYSGSISGWQSFPTVYKYLSPFLKKSPKNKIVFLSKAEENIEKLTQEFPGQIIRKWVNHKEVPEVLAACDMGILIREQSVTNRVAAPTKFAEYLSAGLPVIISENIGDYSAFVRLNNCGIIANGHELPQITKSAYEVRSRMIELVMKNFTKKAQMEHYKELIHNLS